MSAWKKPSRNTCVKKIVTPSRASFLKSMPASRSRSTWPMGTPVMRSMTMTLSRHRSHTISGTMHEAQALHVAPQVRRRWPPRARGRARRAGRCRTRPPPRAASGAGRRPRGARPRWRAWCSSARSSLDHLQHARDAAPSPPRGGRPSAAWRNAPARSTRWPPPRPRSSRRGLVEPAARRPSRRCARACGRRERRHAVLQLGQLVGHSRVAVRSRRVESTWPNLTKIGPSRSSPRRRRSPRGASSRRPSVSTRTSTRTQPWRKLDSASSSRP